MRWQRGNSLLNISLPISSKSDRRTTSTSLVSQCQRRVDEVGKYRLYASSIFISSRSCVLTSSSACRSAMPKNGSTILHTSASRSTSSWGDPAKPPGGKGNLMPDGDSAGDVSNGGEGDHGGNDGEGSGGPDDKKGNVPRYRRSFSCAICRKRKIRQVKRTGNRDSFSVTDG